MSKLKNYITSYINLLKDYLSRMNDNKIECMIEAKNIQRLLGR